MTVSLRLPDEMLWRAVLMKDRRFDGRFVYGASTTGIYCRPSCPARNPKRRNTIIFRTAREAERQGYGACRRCHPNSLAPAEKSIKSAIDYIEQHLDQPISLEVLSRATGLSPHHLQETFKRIVGLSPKALCNVRRAVLFKRLLLAGHSIVEACYLAGYGSSRALYEKASKSLGMTPAVCRRGGLGIRIRYATIDAALGTVLIAATQRGICAVLLGRDGAVLTRELQADFPHAALRRAPSDIWTSLIAGSEREDPMLASLPFDLRARIFQARIQHALSRRAGT